MIKFFRNIRRQLANDNKPIQYLRYAIGEIVLVVIGILIALQINNWNEYRKERIIEKEVLIDILTNLEQNNSLIHESLAMLEDFDKSSDIVLEVLTQKIPYSDTLGKHFFASTRSGGLLFPLSSSGYESLKNQGFNIIRSDSLKDQIMDLFEVSIKRVGNIAQWTMDTSAIENSYQNTVLRQEPGQLLYPVNFDELIKDNRFYSMVNSIKDSKRGFLKENIIDFLDKSKHLAQHIKKELKSD